MNYNNPIWDATPRPPLPSLPRDLATDACVIGLGGSGLACVLELVALGRRVVGIDAAHVASGAAGRNGGILRAGVAAFHHHAVEALGRERVARLHRLTLEEIARVAAETPGAVRRTGSLRIAMTTEDREDCERELRAMLADGFRAARYAGPLGEGLFFPDNAALHPVERCRALERRALDGGAQLFERTRALSITGNEVATDHGTIRCDRVVVAVDGRLESLLPELVGAVRTARLQMLATAPARDVAIPCPVSANFGFDYWQQLSDGTVVLGGGRDRAMDAEWTSSDEPSSAMQEYLDRVLRERIRTRAPVTHRWAASVSFSTSGLPMLAEVRPGVWACGGYSGTGNLLGALAGRAAARLACGEQSEIASLLAPQSAARAC